MVWEGLRSDPQLKTGLATISVKDLSSQVSAISKDCVNCLDSLFHHLTVLMWKQFFFPSSQNLFYFKTYPLPLIILPCTKPMCSCGEVGKIHMILANLPIGTRKAAARSPLPKPPLFQAQLPQHLLKRQVLQPLLHGRPSAELTPSYQCLSCTRRIANWT